MADQSFVDPVGKDIAASAFKALVAKAQHPWRSMLVLSCLAGAFIAFGSIMSLVTQAYIGDVDLVRPNAPIADVRKRRVGRVHAAPSQTSQPVSLLQLITRGNSPGGDDVCSFSAITA